MQYIVLKFQKNIFVAPFLYCLYEASDTYLRYRNDAHMALIKSISGIRGTIGGKPGTGLTPLDLVKFTAAYASWLQQRHKDNKKVVLGRDGRMSGEMVR